MKRKTNFIWFVVISSSINILIVTISAFCLYKTMTVNERNIVIEIFKDHFHYIFVPATLLIFGYGFVLDWFYNFFIKPLNRLKEETGLILTVNPSLRVQVDGSRDVASLAELINQNMDQYETLKNSVQKKIDHARAETEIEKNIFASIVSELTEGVVICNANGQIILCNEQAKRILSSLRHHEFYGHKEEYEKEKDHPDHFVGIGRSVFSVIDRYLMGHAIDDITHKLSNHRPDTATSFVMVNKQQHMFRVEAVPVLDEKRDYNGFILIIYNITEELEKDALIISHLNSLISNVRAKVSAIRSCAELIHDFSGIKNKEHQRLLDIILKESTVMSDIINHQSAFNYAMKIKNRWPLIPSPLVDLLSMIKTKFETVENVPFLFEKHLIYETILVDRYSFIITFAFVLVLLAEHTNAAEFFCSKDTNETSIVIAIKWQGKPITSETLESWMNRVPQVGKERMSLTLKEVFDHHEIELISTSDRNDNSVSYLHFFLPVYEDYTIASKNEITVSASQRPEFYDFDLFNHQDSHLKAGNRQLKDIQYTVFDTETTGLDPRGGDEIISIGAVRVVNLKVLRQDCFEQLVNPDRPPSRESVKIHGITPSMLADQPNIKSVLPLFNRFVDDTVLIAHNAAFDMCMLKMQEETSRVRFTNPVLDTMLLSAVVHPKQTNHSLEHIARRLGVTIVNRHTALGDAVAAAEIFTKLVTLLTAMGIDTLQEAVEASKKTFLSRLKY